MTQTAAARRVAIILAPTACGDMDLARRLVLIPGGAGIVRQEELAPVSAVHHANEMMLAAAGRHWASLEAEPVDGSAFPVQRQAACRLLEQSFSIAPTVLFSAPSFCRVLPIWRAALAETGAEAVFLLAPSDPDLTAARLRTEGRSHAAGAFAAWLRHAFDAERDMPRHQTIVVPRRAAWPKIAAAACAGLSAPAEGLADLLARALEQLLRPCPSAPSFVPEESADGLRTMAHEVLDLIETRGEAATSSLDALRQRFDSACRLFGPTLDAVDRATRRVEALEAQRGAAEARLLAARAQAEDLERRHTEAKVELARASDAKRAKLTARIERLSAKFDTRVKRPLLRSLDSARAKAPPRPPDPLSFPLPPDIVRVPPLIPASADLGTMLSATSRDGSTLRAFHRLSGAPGAAGPNDGALCHVVGAGPVGPIELRHIWHSDDRTLRLRLEPAGDGAAPCLMQALQWGVSEPPRLLTIAEMTWTAARLAFADIRLDNPYMPVLFCVRAGVGQPPALALLPFPSLCSGGAHHAELAATLRGGDAMAELAAMSRLLLCSALSGEQAPQVGTIRVDLAGAVGSEPIFGPSLRKWLAVAMSLGVSGQQDAGRSDGATDPLVASLEPAALDLEPAIAERIAQRAAAGRACLVLPSDGIPSLLSVTARAAPAEGPRGRSLAAFLLADASTRQPLWNVRLPSFGDALLAFQPRNAPPAFPILDSVSPAEGDLARRGAACIRFRASHAGSSPQLLFPRSPAHGAPILEVPDDVQGRVLLVLPSVPESQLAGLLATLRAQTIAREVEVLAPQVQTGPAREVLERVLEAGAPGRYHIAPPDDLETLLPSAPFVAVLSEAVFLHDPRTLETLRLLAAQPGVGSAGCLVVEPGKGAGDIEIRSFGILASDHEDGATLLDADCLGALAQSTFPVVAADSLFMTAAATFGLLWRGQPGPGGIDALDYGIRAVRAGLSNLCTTAVSVTLQASLPQATAEARRVALAAGLRLPAVTRASLDVRKVQA